MSELRLSTQDRWAPSQQPFLLSVEKLHQLGLLNVSVRRRLRDLRVRRARGLGA